MGYFPSLLELAVLGIASAGVCLLGYLLFRAWSIEHSTRPLWLPMGAGLVAAGIYATVWAGLWAYEQNRWEAEPRHLVFNPPELGAAGGMPGSLPEEAAQAPEDAPRYVHILVYGILFGIPPILYYCSNILTAFTDNPLEHIYHVQVSPWDAGPFKKAQTLAMKGDIEGAVSMYLNYSHHRMDAQLAAAKLLVQDGRYREAAELFRELRESYPEKVQIWGEASFELARLVEVYFNDKLEATHILQEIIARDPDGAHGQMAKSELIRMHEDEDVMLERLDAAFQFPEPSPPIVPGTLPHGPSSPPNPPASGSR